MCGIAGCIDLSGNTLQADLRATVVEMTMALAHRGPDHSDYWVDTQSGIALGHRRLAIVDLSPEGYQPMHSGDNRYVIIFNGEIYNFGELRNQLSQRGYTFRGTSDTEVMLSAFQEWGVENSIQRFIGMFAFALWDKQKQVLHLVRDRLGIKPLYYGWMNNTFLFGSELKALRAHPDFEGQVDSSALALYFRHGYVPSPYTIYTGIHQLKPGQYLCLHLDDNGSGPSQPTAYWSGRDIAQRGIITPFLGSDLDALEQLDELLRDAVKIRMVADVPLGAFLSGGIDSSIVVALMQVQASQPVRTFSIGFDEEQYNEAEYAKAVARHLGTDHTELYVTPNEAMEVIPKLPVLYDEPFADSSQIPTFLVSNLARRSVTVSLSGDGGDELFAGYTTYTHSLRVWQDVQRIPQPMRRLAGGLTFLSPNQWDSLLKLAGHRLNSFSGKRIHLAADLIQVGETREKLYQRLGSHWADPTDIIFGSEELPTPWTTPASWVQTDNYISWMQAIDLITYLPDDILVKLDRASMGVALEARVPLLDHRVVEFAWALPPTMKIRNTQGKWLLRQLLYQYVPEALINRPKKGFSVPIKTWLRGPLRDWAENLLDEQTIREQGFLNAGRIRKRWEQFLDGTFDQERDFWTLLMFQAWLEAY